MPVPRWTKVESPGRETVTRVEAASARIAADNAEIDAWAQAYLSNHVQRIATDLELLDRFAAQGSSVLEMGSAPFLFTLAAQDAGYRITGVDVDPSRFSKLIEAESMTVLATNFETERVDLPDGAVEIVIMNEVFEHLRIDMISTMEEVLRLLAPGGKLLLSTPNLKSARGLFRYLFKGQSTAIAEDIYGEYKKLRDVGHMGHVREYSPQEVTAFLERIGFEVNDLIYRGRHRKKGYRRAGQIYPPLMPFFTLVAQKPRE